MTSQVLTAETVKSCSPGTSVHFNQTKRRHVSEVSLPVYKLSPYSTDTNIVSDDSSVLISRVTGIGEKQGIVGRVAGREGCVTFKTGAVKSCNGGQSRLSQR